MHMLRDFRGIAVRPGAAVEDHCWRCPESSSGKLLRSGYNNDSSGNTRRRPAGSVQIGSRLWAPL